VHGEDACSYRLTGRFTSTGLLGTDTLFFKHKYGTHESVVSCRALNFNIALLSFRRKEENGAVYLRMVHSTIKYVLHSCLEIM